MDELRSQVCSQAEALAEIRTHLVYIREDLTAIREHLKGQNGRLQEHDRFIWRLQAWGLPLVVLFTATVSFLVKLAGDGLFR